MIEVLLPWRGFYGFNHMWTKRVLYSFYINCVFYKQYMCGNDIPFVRHCRVHGVDKSRLFFSVTRLFCFIWAIYIVTLSVHFPAFVNNLLKIMKKSEGHPLCFSLLQAPFGFVKAPPPNGSALWALPWIPSPASRKLPLVLSRVGNSCHCLL